ncbi:MAG: SusF/SusE family outer membrane protein [Bacteroidetes bacterium]|nr:SusF/SusE family outer membrane protein [Bacteroidota bacterium]
MIRKYLSFMMVSFLLFQACKEDSLGPEVKLGAAPTITTPSGGNTYVLEEATVADHFSDFTWTSADFGFQAAITYTVELDKAGNGFANAVALGTTNSNTLTTITNEKVNSILLAKELPGGAPADIEVRVRAKVSSDVTELISPSIAMTVTPFEAAVDYPKLQVPGSYQGWDPANTSTVITSLKSDGTYEGYIWVADPDAKHKFTQGLSWDTNWGDTGLDGTLDPGGDDIPLGAAGMYKMNVDLNQLTYTDLLTSWGLIGDATPTGWDSDTDMNYDVNTGHLTLTVDLTVGSIKFRANDGWDINLGDDGPNGKLEYNGADIAIAEAGNYTIELILNEPKYSYTVTKN